MTAFSDETGRDWLPLKYEDGPDFCTVTFATGAAFALTVHPERMKLMEAALSAAPVETITVPFNPCLAKLRDGEPFFVLIGRDKQAPNAVMTWARDREAAEGPSPWVEQAREVAATMAAYSGAAPVAQEPVAWVEFTEAGLIRFWTSDPARAEAERTRRSLTKFTLSELIALVGRPRTPPATPAGVGADEIAQIIATKCFDPRVIDSSGKPFWKKSQWREAQQAANAILLLLSGGRSEQERSQMEGSL